MTRLKSSYYNLLVEHGKQVLVFNGVTNALLAIPAHLFEQFASLLGPARDRRAGIGFSEWNPPAFDMADVPLVVRKHVQALRDAGVLVAEDDNERDMLRGSYGRNRTRAPFFVTITTTLDCNMRCYYCYQKDGQLDSMSDETCDSIITWTKTKLSERGFPALYVDWYGGEPMLNRRVIERYSQEMSAYCEAIGVEYRASMICNGTAWPDDATGFVATNKIGSIQFTLDGSRQHHDKRRGLIKSDGARGRTPSFDEVMSVVGKLVGKIRIYLRINVDPWTGQDCFELIDDFAARGWLGPDTLFYPYVAVINAMTDHCGFVGKAAAFREFEAQFDQLQNSFFQKLSAFTGAKTLETVQYFPNRVIVNCAAVSDNAVVFGPNGLAYKCGLDVGDHDRAHGLIDQMGKVGANPSPKALPEDRWDKYDPFTHASCSECQYLPICMGGCPKSQIERDLDQIRLQSQFWESNFERIVRDYYVASGHH